MDFLRRQKTSVPKVPNQVREWCRVNNWSEPHLVDQQWWAFPSQAVMPLPLPEIVQPYSPRKRLESDLYYDLITIFLVILLVGFSLMVFMTDLLASIQHLRTR
jgi:hypothetical protein